MGRVRGLERVADRKHRAQGLTGGEIQDGGHGEIIFFVRFFIAIANWLQILPILISAVKLVDITFRV